MTHDRYNGDIVMVRCLPKADILGQCRERALLNDRPVMARGLQIGKYVRTVVFVERGQRTYRPEEMGWR